MLSVNILMTQILTRNKHSSTTRNTNEHLENDTFSPPYRSFTIFVLSIRPAFRLLLPKKCFLYLFGGIFGYLFSFLKAERMTLTSHIIFETSKSFQVFSKIISMASVAAIFVLVVTRFNSNVFVLFAYTTK